MDTVYGEPLTEQQTSQTNYSLSASYRKLISRKNFKSLY